MTTDTALIEKREELKRRLAAGEYKTLVDVLFDWMSRVIQKITRNPHPISPWYSSVMLSSIIMLLVFAALFLMGDVSVFMRQVAIFPRGAVPLLVIVGYFSSLILVAGNLHVHRVFMTFHDSVLDVAESLATLNDFESWLVGICNRKVHLMISIIGGVLINGYISYIYNTIFGFSSPTSIRIGVLLYDMVLLAFLYLLLYMAILSARAGRYHLKLYTADPANSEVISHLTVLFSNLLYLVAIFAASVMLFLAYIGFLTIQNLVLLILLFWIPLIAMFVFYHNSLSSIVRRAKGNTLNEIQARIEELHASEKLGEKDTMETINRLMDYYDRIKSTRSSRIDLEAVLHLINSLLLPLLALVLGNIDKILALLPQRP
jgi:hypothetical protein